MTAAPTIRPESVAGAILTAGGVSYDTADATKTFYMRLARIQEDFYVRLDETTGDGDANPTFDTGGLGYGRLVLTGWMVSGGAMNISRLINANRTGGADGTNRVFDLTYSMGSGREQNLTVIAHRIRINWDFKSARVPVSLYLQVTDFDFDRTVNPLEDATS